MKQADVIRDHYCWTTNEQAGLRAVFLQVIKGIVGKYSGTIEIDLTTNQVQCNIPIENEAACAIEIEEVLSKYGC